MTAPKVIHVVENLGNGAVENWLLRMLAHGRARGEALDWTFYCALGEPGRHDGLARDLGAKVIHTPAPLGEIKPFFKGLRNHLAASGYDVMHAHHDIVSGVYMAASAGQKLRRIVHVHNADEHVPTANPVKAALMREPLRWLGLRADKVVGISNHTLDTFLKARPRRPGRDIVHYYGVDPSAFTADQRWDRTAFRASLDLPPDALILLFGGRLTPEKNPAMTLDVLAELRRLEPSAVAVFVGAGSLEGEITARAEALGLTGFVRMMGWRQDMPRIMSAADWFILPRPEYPMEGFGLAVVEAQLAGLHMLLSKGVPDDPLLATASYRRLALADGARAWAGAAVDLFVAPTPDPEAARAALAASPMDMDRAFEDLMRLQG